MDRLSLFLPGDGDGPQARVALLPCEIAMGNSDFES